jgi:hypothetical protein
VQKTFSTVIIVLSILLAACSPKFDWRDVRGTEAPFTVLLPAKPGALSREMTLSGVKLNLHMTAADVDNISFSVGAAKLDDPSKIPEVLAAMQKGMISNIRGTPANESVVAGQDVVSYGTLSNGQPVKLVGRFVARGAWVYQIVIIGKDKLLTPEVVDTFMTSFKAS